MLGTHFDETEHSELMPLQGRIAGIEFDAIEARLNPVTGAFMLWLRAPKKASAKFKILYDGECQYTKKKF